MGPMGDTLPPGSGPTAGAAPEPPAPQAPQAPAVYPPGVYPPPSALALVTPRQLAPVAPPPVEEPPRDRYAPDPKPRSQVWEGFKWPLRKTLLGIYLLVQAARRHKLVALVVTVLLVALIAMGVIVRQLTLPGPPPLAIEHPGLPPLPNSVIHYLHGEVTFNGQEVWDSLDPSLRAQSGATERQIQASLDQERAQGIQTTRMVYSGGYQATDGTSHYTIELTGALSGQQQQTVTLYFVVGSSGLITRVSSL